MTSKECLLAMTQRIPLKAGDKQMRYPVSYCICADDNGALFHTVECIDETGCIVEIPADIVSASEPIKGKTPGIQWTGEITPAEAIELMKNHEPAYGGDILYKNIVSIQMRVTQWSTDPFYSVKLLDRNGISTVSVDPQRLRKVG